MTTTFRRRLKHTVLEQFVMLTGAFCHNFGRDGILGGPYVIWSVPILKTLFIDKLYNVLLMLLHIGGDERIRRRPEKRLDRKK